MTNVNDNISIITDKNINNVNNNISDISVTTDNNVNANNISTPKPELVRVLNWFDLTFVGVGATIGSGIFVITGIVASERTGPALVLSYVSAAFVCFLCGLCYAEYAALSPKAGSAYTYAYESLGRFGGWIIGWDLLLEYAVAGSTVSQGWSKYMQELLRLFGFNWPKAISQTFFDYSGATNSVMLTGAIIDLPAFIIPLIITYLVIRGVKDSARFNAVMVSLKIVIILFVIFAGIGYIDTSNYTPFAPYGYTGFSVGGNAVGMLAGSALVFFSYIGFDSVSCAAEEAKKPETDIPLGILLSLSISTILYCGVSIVLCGMVPYNQIDKFAPLSSAFKIHGLAWAEYIVAIGAVIGITSVLLVTLLAQPRILFAMSRDKLLPKVFSDVHPTYHTPYKGTLITGMFVAVVGSCIPLSLLVELVSIGTLLAFCVVCISVIVLRYTKPDIHRPFKCPLYPFIPIVGAISCFCLMLSLPHTNWYRLFGWLGVGMIIYFFYGRKNKPDTDNNSIREIEMQQNDLLHPKSPDNDEKLDVINPNAAIMKRDSGIISTVKDNPNTSIISDNTVSHPRSSIMQRRSNEAKENSEDMIQRVLKRPKHFV